MKNVANAFDTRSYGKRDYKLALAMKRIGHQSIESDDVDEEDENNKEELSKKRVPDAHLIFIVDRDLFKKL